MTSLRRVLHRTVNRLVLANPVVLVATGGLLLGLSLGALLVLTGLV